MAASYPSSVKSFSTKATDDVIEAEHINSIQDETTAVEGGLINGIAHHVIPATTLLYNLGSDSRRWGNIYAAHVPVIQTTTSTGTQNDFAASAGCGLLKLNNASALTFTGIAAGFDGQRMRVISIGAGPSTINSQDAGSSAANRIITGVTGPIQLSPSTGGLEMVYESSVARWRVLDHVQGTWLTPTYAAGDFTPDTGLWTVEAGDVTELAYSVDGPRRMMRLSFSIVTTSASGPPNTLRIKIPDALVAGQQVEGSFYYNENGTADSGLLRVAAGDTKITLIKKNSATWAVATSTTDVRGSVTFELG